MHRNWSCNFPFYIFNSSAINVSKKVKRVQMKSQRVTSKRVASCQVACGKFLFLSYFWPIIVLLRKNLFTLLIPSSNIPNCADTLHHAVSMTAIVDNEKRTAITQRQWSSYIWQSNGNSMCNHSVHKTQKSLEELLHYHCDSFATSDDLNSGRVTVILLFCGKFICFSILWHLISHMGKNNVSNSSNYL